MSFYWEVIRMAPTSTGKDIDLGENLGYKGPPYFVGLRPLNYFIHLD